MSAMKVVLLSSMLLGLTAAQSSWTKGTASFTGVPANTQNADFNAAAVKSAPNGACGYGTLTAAQYPFFLLAGVSPKNPIAQGAQKGCGTCLEVQCTDAQLCDNNTPITVTVFDSCIECEANQINLYATAFSKFASLDVGRVGIEYKQVACPASGPVVVHIDTFRPDKGGYVKLSLRNVAGASGIKSIAFRTTGTTNNWRPLKNTYGAVWEASQLSTLPLDLQVTKTDGTSIVLSGVITKATTAGDVKAATNFKA